VIASGTALAVDKIRLPQKCGGSFGLGLNSWEAQNMTSLAEAENRFGHVVRGAGGVIFGIEKDAFVHEEKLQIGTPDGFVKMASFLTNQTLMRFCKSALPSLSNMQANYGRLHA